MTRSVTAAISIATTDDVFLGGALHMLQPAKGYRAGVEAVLLAAAAPSDFVANPLVLDAGAGVGVVGLAFARRVAAADVTLLDVQPDLLGLARENVRRNGLDARCRVVAGDVTGQSAALAAMGVAPESFDLALANPPFGVEGQGRAPADPLRARAHEMPAGDLEAWGKALARALKPGGRVVMIHRADALADVLEALAPRFGGLEVTPIHAYADAPAIRLLIQGHKASRAPLAINPPLVLHQPDGTYRPEVDRVLRAAEPLALRAARGR